MFIRRIVKKLNVLKHSFVRKYREYGFRLAFSNLIYDFNGATLKVQKVQNRMFDIKTQEINRYIKKYCDKAMADVDCYNVVDLDAASSLDIWTFWYQGIEHAPELVKVCLERMQNVATNEKHDLHVLTMKDVRQYIDIPDYIECKVRDGNIGMALFSDFIRISLLEKYGGIWIDPTCYVTRIPQNIKNAKFFSCKSDKNTYHLISREQWANYCLGTNQIHNVLFQFLRNSLLNYWKEENTDVDYLLTDYLIRFAYENISEVREQIDGLWCNNSQRGKLMILLNEKFDSSIWQEIQKDTWLFKLTYKHKTKKNVKAGNITFYGKLIAETYNV